MAVFDINTVANKVYKSNFGLEPTIVFKYFLYRKLYLICFQANVEHLPAEYFEKLDAEAWLLSPPCQPFTRGGKRMDDEDPRSTGFLHLLDVLRKMRNPPRYMFLENVLNFEVSRTHERMIEVLKSLGFRIEEYLVEPTDPWVGIPNARLRYYLAATRTSEGCGEYTEHIYRSFEEVLGPAPSQAIRPISDFLDSVDDDDTKYLVPLRYLTDYKNYRHDIKKPDSLSSTTFTKAYGSKHIIGTGSFLQTKRLSLEYACDDPEVLVTLGLRFFSPNEIARLHGLPMDGPHAFHFDPSTTLSQQYKLLGNSMNIKVVSLILKRLFA